MTTAPLTPAACDLSGFGRMMIDIKRLRSSKFDAVLSDAVWRAGVNLWLSSWESVPAASLDDDEGALASAAGLGRDVKTWRKVRDGALAGWRKCTDGRLYHATVAEYALEAWLSKLGQRKSSEAGNAKRYGKKFDPAEIEADIAEAVTLLEALNPDSKRSNVYVVVSQKASGGGPETPPDGKSSAAEKTPDGTK